MHPRLPASIIHGMRFGCTLAYPPSSPSTPSSFTGCTSDAPYATHRHSTQGARSLHPSPPTVTIIPHKVHIGCTLAVSLSSLTRCTLQAPRPYNPHYSQGAHWTHPRCITMHMPRSTHVLRVGAMHAPCALCSHATHVRCVYPAHATRTTHMLRTCNACALHMSRTTRIPCMCGVYAMHLPRATHVQCMCTACAMHMLRATHTCQACA